MTRPDRLAIPALVLLIGIAAVLATALKVPGVAAGTGHDVVAVGLRLVAHALGVGVGDIVIVGFVTSAEG